MRLRSGGCCTWSLYSGVKRLQSRGNNAADMVVQIVRGNLRFGGSAGRFRPEAVGVKPVVILGFRQKAAQDFFVGLYHALQFIRRCCGCHTSNVSSRRTEEQ